MSRVSPTGSGDLGGVARGEACEVPSRGGVGACHIGIGPCCIRPHLVEGRAANSGRGNPRLPHAPSHPELRANASEEHAVPIQGGFAAVSRGYLIFLMWAGLGYLAVLLSVGPAFSASEFIVFLFGFWALVAIFLVALVLWRRQKRRF